eukprot:272896-Prymnesium_polylepis.1
MRTVSSDTYAYQHRRIASVTVDTTPTVNAELRSLAQVAAVGVNTDPYLNTEYSEYGSVYEYSGTGTQWRTLDVAAAVDQLPAWD